VGIAHRASMAALKFGVVLQRSTFGQCFFLPTVSMNSIPATQPTFDLNSFSVLWGIIVEVQLFGTKKAATIRIVFRWLLHPDLIDLIVVGATNYVS
jgi:hypothetical protein